MANPNSTQSTQPQSTSTISSASSTSASRPSTNQKKNWSSRGKQTGQRTGGSSNKPNQSNRNAKRARWAKRNKPTAKPVVRREPVNEYLCVCHGEAARKPKAGLKESAKDPETGRMKDRAKGLGHWHCNVTGKPTKVSVRKAVPKEVAVVQTSVPANQ